MLLFSRYLTALSFIPNRTPIQNILLDFTVRISYNKNITSIEGYAMSLLDNSQLKAAVRTLSALGFSQWDAEKEVVGNGSMVTVKMFKRLNTKKNFSAPACRTNDRLSVHASVSVHTLSGTPTSPSITFRLYGNVVGEFWVKLEAYSLSFEQIQNNNNVSELEKMLLSQWITANEYAARLASITSDAA